MNRMMKIKKFGMLFVAILFFTACQIALTIDSTDNTSGINNAIKTIQIITTEESSNLSTAIPSLTEINKIQPSPQIKTPEPILVHPSLTSELQSANEHCPKVDEIKLGDILLSGSIVSVSELPSNTAFLINLETGERKIIPISENKTNTDFNVSPDGHMLAYFERGNDRQGESEYVQLVLMNSLGEIINTFDLPNSTVTGYWLDQNHFVSSENMNTVEEVRPTILRVQDVITGDYSYLEPVSLPDYYRLTEENFLWKATAAYHPSLRWVVYQSITDGEPHLSLWDEQEHKIITRITDYELDPVSMPAWSPDGEMLVYVDQGYSRKQGPYYENEIYSLSKNGTLTRLTYLSDEFDKVRIGFMGWSPDGSKLAFWLRTTEDFENDYLAILDIKTNQLIQTCIKGYWSIKPTWSPDGNWISLTSLAKRNKPDGIMIVDKNGTEIFHLQSGILEYVMGWMNIANK